MIRHFYLTRFFLSLREEERINLKKTFEGDFSNVGKFSTLTEKYLEGDTVLFCKIIPTFMLALKENNEIKDDIIAAQREKINIEISSFYEGLENCPGPFYEKQIIHNEHKLSNLSITTLENEANSIFDGVVADVLKNVSPDVNHTRENYFFVFCLNILFDKFKRDESNSEKYSTHQKDESKLYKYYKSLDVDLKAADKQFSKYNLLSIINPEQIISGLPNRIFDATNKSQFLIDIPSVLLDLFTLLMKNGKIKSISFLVESNVVFQTSARYFILLGNEKPQIPLFLVNFEGDTRDAQATKRVLKEADTPNTFPPYVSAGCFYDTNGDSAWYFIDDRNIYFEEILADPEILDDCVVTKLIHAEYFLKAQEIFISHIDHEYIFYSYDEFDIRQNDFTQKGSARKRIKTFKIDDSEIPLVTEEKILFINTIIEYMFDKPYLFNGFFREILKIL